MVAGGKGIPSPWEVGWTAQDQVHHVRAREASGAGLHGPWVAELNKGRGP